MSDTTSLNQEDDPKLLNRKAVLEVYAAIINRTITDEMHQALVHEIFEHVDAQGRLLARAGNALHKDGCPQCGRSDHLADPTTGWKCANPFHPLLDEIQRAMG